MTTPRILTCAVVTLLTLTACTATDPVEGPSTAGGVAGLGGSSGGQNSAPPSAVALTAEQYRAELEEARGPVRSAVKKVAATTKLTNLGKRLDETAAAIDGAVTRLAALAPPPEAKAGHDAYVQALRDLSVAFGHARQDADAQKVCTGPAALSRMGKAGELADVAKAAEALTGYPADVIPVKVAEERKRRLPNGRFIVSESLPADAYLEVKNGYGLDSVVVLVRGGKKAMSLYVRGKSKYRIQGVRDGNYKIYYSLGEDWDARNRVFTRSCTFEQFGEPIRFKTTTSGGQIRWNNWTITMNAGRGGNVPPKKVKPGDFPA
ncbi:hypothetical protein FHS43_006426 [Streptosporangium becharense]|uniref:Lipoprotein n=1 Tax=Streptosporangium becharense TaxID=1816182 RepID=A0A7W9MJ31_9ACTN|nr:hypothetical protein [Streptosporangium becharense]MBB2915106.1 hypothetical protein [Streptosporangium becharense]MBB5822822.1 hypothetical protein [Streptosporangium becharense]